MLADEAIRARGRQGALSCSAAPSLAQGRIGPAEAAVPILHIAWGHKGKNRGHPPTLRTRLPKEALVSIVPVSMIAFLLHGSNSTMVGRLLIGFSELYQIPFRLIGGRPSDMFINSLMENENRKRVSTHMRIGCW
jgi:hypothetical protein